MKIICVVFFVLMAQGVLFPVQLKAAESGTNFRDRVSSSSEVAMSDIAEEIMFGREVAARIIARYGLYDNPTVMKYVNLVGQALALNTSRPELAFHFAVLNTDEINGYAAPGGYVFVTRGAISKMKNEAELAGVLAHEIGHIVEKHVVNELKIKGTDETAAAGLAALIGGTSQSARTAFAQAVDTAMDILFKDGYSREDEIQADRDAVLFSAMAGYEPGGLINFFERVSALKGKQTEVLDKTHPSYATRIDWIRGSISQEGLDAGNYKDYQVRFSANLKMMK
jgi:predicted Zn-dependent protease